LTSNKVIEFIDVGEVAVFQGFRGIELKGNEKTIMVIDAGVLAQNKNVDVGLLLELCKLDLTQRFYKSLNQNNTIGFPLKLVRQAMKNFKTVSVGWLKLSASYFNDFQTLKEYSQTLRRVKITESYLNFDYVVNFYQFAKQSKDIKVFLWMKGMNLITYLDVTPNSPIVHLVRLDSTKKKIKHLILSVSDDRKISLNDFQFNPKGSYKTNNEGYFISVNFCLPMSRILGYNEYKVDDNIPEEAIRGFQWINKMNKRTINRVLVFSYNFNNSCADFVIRNYKDKKYINLADNLKWKAFKNLEAIFKQILKLSEKAENFRMRIHTFKDIQNLSKSQKEALDLLADYYIEWKHQVPFGIETQLPVTKINFEYTIFESFWNFNELGVMVKKLRALQESAMEVTKKSSHADKENLVQRKRLHLLPLKLSWSKEELETEKWFIRMTVEEFTKTLNKMSKISKIYGFKPKKENWKLKSGESVDWIDFWEVFDFKGFNGIETNSSSGKLWIISEGVEGVHLKKNFFLDLYFQINPPDLKGYITPEWFENLADSKEVSMKLFSLSRQREIIYDSFDEGV
jgi:hypothetical protein